MKYQNLFVLLTALSLTTLKNLEYDFLVNARKLKKSLFHLKCRALILKNICRTKRFKEGVADFEVSLRI